MKKTIAFIMAVFMVFSLCACGGGTKSVTDLAFEKAAEAYGKIKSAYEITDTISGDVYEAWRLGIYDDDEIIDEGVAYLADELSLSEDELRDGLAYVITTMVYKEEWEDASEEDKENRREYDYIAFEVFEDSLFSFCVEVVDAAYIVNGKIDEAQKALDEAKVIMKEMSKEYSDYEHYPNLKGYYTTTSSFFEFCSDPDGSFEQVKDTINDYRKEARDYSSDLEYIFEE